MQPPIESIQSQFLFGNRAIAWRPMDPLDWDKLKLPDHLNGLVFRILIAKIPATHLFEISVSEQCPKETYDRLGRNLALLPCNSFIVNLVHVKSPNAHLIFWRRSRPKRLFHLELDFNHLSRFDKQALAALRSPSPFRLEQFQQLLEGQSVDQGFFRTLQHYLSVIPCTTDQAYQTLVDLVLKLVFLIFVQRKGWLNLDPCYLENKMNLCQRKGLSIVHCFFKPLFARMEGFRVAEPILLGELPCLGGGLFSFQPEHLPVLPNHWCLDLYHTLVSQYSFSLFEARGERRVAGISPEILGYVFENLIKDRERKRQGVFYTPSPMAEKQVKAAFEALLKDKKGQSRQRFLKCIRILDPSCGSGTYLVAAFQFLLQHRLKSAPKQERTNGKLYLLKRSIVLENLYGIDINPMAVRLTEVRLWLNMIQDLEIAEPGKAPPLPNLQHHLRPGDFLSQHTPINLNQLREWPKHQRLETLRRKFPSSSAKQRPSMLKHIFRLERECLGYLERQEQDEQRAIQHNKMAQGSLPGMKPGNQSLRPKKSPAASPMLHIVFSRVMLAGGFDLVLGNPPWLSALKIPAQQKNNIRKDLHLPSDFKLTGQVDLSLYFLFAAMSLVKKGGHLGFLLPGKLLQAQFANTTRAFLGQRCRIDYLMDYGIDHHTLFKADTFPLAIGVSKTKPPGDHRIKVERHGRNLHQVFSRSQVNLSDRSGTWRLRPHHKCISRHWQPLSDTELVVRRGIVTNAKKHFVFSNPPPFIRGSHLKPLLRGRDIGPKTVQPGNWIYWPFDEGPQWFASLGAQERDWLKRTGKLRQALPYPQLKYGPKPLGPWLLIWKYLASSWQVALLRYGDWIPDQTTYYINFSTFGAAYRFYAYFHSELANNELKSLAERGKDRCFFYYAHTVEKCPIPPNIHQRAMVIPSPRDCLPPDLGKGLWSVPPAKKPAHKTHQNPPISATSLGPP